MQSLLTLKTVLDRIDGDSFDTLEGRITFQKRIYLIQGLGLDLGYRFSWNQYGPYSSELAQDGMLLEAGVAEEPKTAESLRFKPAAEQKLLAFSELAKPIDRVGQAAWLELLSSLHYLATSSGSHRLPEDQKTRSAINEKLLQMKPYLKGNESLLDEGWERLDQAMRGSLAAA